MKVELFLLVLETLFGVFMVIIFHEMIHWVIAKIFCRQPKILFSKLMTPTIVYVNNQNDWQNLIITSSAPLIVITIGLFITVDSIFTITVKILCLMNIFNLFPITTDGEVIILSILNLLKKKNA